MAIATAINLSGTELNTPWTEVTPNNAAAPGAGTFIEKLAYALGFRNTPTKPIYKQDTSVTITLNTGTPGSTPVVYALIGPISGTYSLVLAVLKTKLTAWDETEQDAATGVSITVTVDGTATTITEGTAGHTFDSDEVLVDAITYSAFIFKDTGSALSNLFTSLSS